jgi:hypothetical protein
MAESRPRNRDEANGWAQTGAIDPSSAYHPAAGTFLIRSAAISCLTRDGVIGSLRRRMTMQQPANHHLAQMNIGRIRYDIDDPRMADFTNNLAMVNDIAEEVPGSSGGMSTKAATPQRPGLMPTPASSSTFQFGRASRPLNTSFGRRSISASMVAAPIGLSLLKVQRSCCGG